MLANILRTDMPMHRPLPTDTDTDLARAIAVLARGLGQAPLDAGCGKRLVGWQVGHLVSVQEKVEAIHDLAADEQVAARVATDFLRRPEVASRAAADDTARHLFNKAQFDHSGWSRPQSSKIRPETVARANFGRLCGACLSDRCVWVATRRDRGGDGGQYRTPTA